MARINEKLLGHVVNKRDVRITCRKGIGQRHAIDAAVRLRRVTVIRDTSSLVILLDLASTNVLHISQQSMLQENDPQRWKLVE